MQKRPTRYAEYRDETPLRGDAGPGRPTKNMTLAKETYGLAKEAYYECGV